MSEKKNLYESLNWYSQMEIDEIVLDDLSEKDKYLNSAKSKTRASQKKPDESVEKAPSISRESVSFKLESPLKVASDARGLADKATSLQEIKTMLESFEGCQLKKTATNLVFGEGVSNADIMLIGEAPGATEDAEARPFCGESGKLLDKMLATIGLFRDKNFYITNTVFWRPPGNREPTPQEVEICRPFTEKQIALINPKLIVLIGSTAATSLIGDHVKITKIRKEYYQYTNKYLSHEIPVTALFHPAYLLRQPLQKKTMWYDLLHLEDYIAHNKLKI